METLASNATDIGFSWLIVLISVSGYLFTWRKTRQKWSFWMVLSAGWLFLAVSNTLGSLSVAGDTQLPTALRLSSYVLVMASLTLLFLRLSQLMRTRAAGRNGRSHQQR